MNLTQIKKQVLQKFPKAYEFDNGEFIVIMSGTDKSISIGEDSTKKGAWKDALITCNQF